MLTKQLEVPLIFKWAHPPNYNSQADLCYPLPMPASEAKMLWGPGRRCTYWQGFSKAEDICIG